jgi:succinyl-CoA synthetase beta subunit
MAVDYSAGVTADVTSQIIDRLELDSASFASIDGILKSLYALFVDKDATLVEINPLVRKSNGEFLCLDAKVTIDDAAANRQTAIFDAHDTSDDVQEELEAAEHGLVYIRLDGNIGNVVNGAGLAMATNDAIASYGGKSANFLDAGGRATTATMVKAFEIILRDDRVKAILVNIYGGTNSFLK